jgi:hypothetical protein
MNSCFYASFADLEFFAASHIIIWNKTYMTFFITTLSMFNVFCIKVSIFQGSHLQFTEKENIAYKGANEIMAEKIL